MEIRYGAVTADEALAPALRADLLDTWVAATDAGGAVGFTPPAPVPAVADMLDRALARVAEGTDALGVLYAGDRAVGMGLLVANAGRLQSHWRTVLRVMVHPDFQGRGAGAVLMNGLHSTALELGLEQLLLTIRDGLGLDEFYKRFRYREIGRHAGAIRVAPGDDRDEVVLVAVLDRPIG
jgi:GNAT superfamily N-acetyltransferase